MGICPGEDAGAGLASACWPDQKPVRPWGRDSSQSCRLRFPSPDRRRSLSPTRRLEVEWMLADELDYVIGVDTHRDRARALSQRARGARARGQPLAPRAALAREDRCARCDQDGALRARREQALHTTRGGQTRGAARAHARPRRSRGSEEGSAVPVARAPRHLPGPAPQRAGRAHSHAAACPLQPAAPRRRAGARRRPSRPAQPRNPRPGTHP